MKKFVFIIHICLAFTSSIVAQSWSAVGSGMEIKGTVSAMIVYNGDLYVAGSFDTAGGVPVNNIARWDGTGWDSVGSGLNGAVNSMAVYQGNLYVGGRFTYSGNIFLPGAFAMFDGTAWNSIANADSIESIGSLYTYDSLLFVGWNYPCSTYPNCALHVSQFDGTSFYPIGYDFIYPDGRLNSPYFYSITSYNKEVWAGGAFYNNHDTTFTNYDTSANSIDYWDGSAWVYSGYGLQKNGSYANATVNAMTSDNTYLYAGGVFNGANKLPVSNIARWNGVMWDSLGKGINNAIACLVKYNNNLIAGGAFDSAGGNQSNAIAYWDGINWGSLGSGMSNGLNTPKVLSLIEYNGNLYAGGEFTLAGGVHATNIAMYSGPLAIKNISNNGNLTLFPNPNNGLFTLSLSNVKEKCNVEIYNVMGQGVKSEKLKVQSEEVDLSNQPSGVYFYRVISETGNLIGEGKVVIEK